jgi:serine/threonine-protein kinase RsbW
MESPPGQDGVSGLDVRIPSDVQYIEAIVDQVVRRCEALRFSRRHLALNVPVALTEAISNAILRGNAEDTTKSVRVRADIDSVRLVCEVRDEGPGFDLEGCTEDPTTPANLLREDGRGLFLMRRLMDHVERFTDGENVVRLVLHRARRERGT